MWPLKKKIIQNLILGSPFFVNNAFDRIFNIENQRNRNRKTSMQGNVQQRISKNTSTQFRMNLLFGIKT